MTEHSTRMALIEALENARAEVERLRAELVQQAQDAAADIEATKHENERLRADHMYCAADRRNLEAEVERLRARLDQSQTLAIELGDEVERLRAFHLDAMQQKQALEAEVERLRERERELGQRISFCTGTCRL